jgi:phenylalanyl-tRNA synthetase alpha subunit
VVNMRNDREVANCGLFHEGLFHPTALGLKPAKFYSWYAWGVGRCSQSLVA